MLFLRFNPIGLGERKLLKKTVSEIMLTMLIITTLALAFNIEPVKASGTIYIRADGSIDPPTAPISSVDNVTYTFTDNINDSIVVERDNIVIDGAGYTVQGYGSGNGFYWSGINNVTIKNTNIKNFEYGIYLSTSNNNSISGNNITNNWNGIYLGSSSNSTISGNNITNNTGGIVLEYSSNYNSISGNNITNNTGGIVLHYSSNSSISGNNVEGNFINVGLSSSSNNTISENNINKSSYGLWLEASSNNNFILRNTIMNQHYGISFCESSDNIICHNNFINNTQQVYDCSWDWPEYDVPSVNVWDDGYPSGGNYWSDYNGNDLYSGSYQNETDADGIGDTPYVIYANNTDNYPLMAAYIPDIAVMNLTISKTVVGQQFNSFINLTVQNQGSKIESFNIAIYANETIITTLTNITLTSGASTTITFTWNTAGFAKGNYTIKAYATPVPGETDTADNTCLDSIVTVTIPGDVDGDHWVFLYDAVKLLSRYGAKEGDPQYEAVYDIDNDGRIFLYDAVILLSHYGQRDP
jgi:parallel beta-helix repeat protein